MTGTNQNIKRFFQKIDPAFEDRWVIYEQLERKHVEKNVVWVDVGCGSGNVEVAELGSAARYAVGLDLILPQNGAHAPYVRGDVLHLPFQDKSVDFLTLRFVVEHLREPSLALGEVNRALKIGGVLLFMTTNRLSPYILLPNLVPFSLKNLLIRSVFKVPSTDILPTYHRMNTPRTIKRFLRAAGISSREMLLVQDVNYVRRSITVLSFLLHLLTGMFPWFKVLRSNIICVAAKGA